MSVAWYQTKGIRRKSIQRILDFLFSVWKNAYRCTLFNHCKPLQRGRSGQIEIKRAIPERFDMFRDALNLLRVKIKVRDFTQWYSIYMLEITNGWEVRARILLSQRIFNKILVECWNWLAIALGSYHKKNLHSLWKMFSSPYSVLRNLRVCCRYTWHFGNSVHEVSGSAIKITCLHA